ncbi:PLD nuclease N-terminal domain-containing protein [Terrabacter sp. NPDC080008]|uniref:PLD nuclease N-terminal domain-containing protein n=1 Tax=Terrabacter sp. NPDC080008 TaxID=3155176 RepID=UPI00344B2BE7
MPHLLKEITVLRVVFVALVVFASIYAIVDCLQTDRRLVRVMPKAVWLLAALVPVVGPVFWLVAGRTDARGGPGRAPRGPKRGPGRQPPPGPRGPDDDPDFLRKL